MTAAEGTTVSPHVAHATKLSRTRLVICESDSAD